MQSSKIDILRQLDKLSTPYVDISTLDYDIHSKSFVATYLQLESEGLIASANTPSCGLEVSADGLPSWSVVDIYVTERGSLVLNPPKTIKPSLLSVITNNATLATIIGGVALLVIISLFVKPWLTNTQTQTQDTKQYTQERKNQYPPRPPIK